MTNKIKDTEKYTKKNIDEARFETEQRARDQRDYEVMLMDYIRKEFEGI